MNLVIGENGQLEGAPPLTETTEFTDTDNTDITLTATEQEILSLTINEDIPKTRASFVIGLSFDNTDAEVRTVTIILKRNGTQKELTTLSLLPENDGFIFVYPGGFLDDIVTGDVFTVNAYADVTDVVHIRGDVKESILRITKTTSIIEQDIHWKEDGTNLEPIDNTLDVRLPKLSGVNNSVVVTDSNGVTKDSPVTITDSPAGGSILGLDIYDTEPATGLIQNDFFAVQKDENTIVLNIHNGTKLFKVEMTS